MKNRFFIVLLGCLILTSAQARLGETLSKIKERFGKPAGQPRKEVALWFFEARGGQLEYTVTFNAKGESVAEGLKPVALGDFATETAQDFINLQIEPYRQSKTLRIVKPGERYSFGGRVLTCGEVQMVVVDEPNGILVVWTRKGLPSVMALRPEMMMR